MNLNPTQWHNNMTEIWSLNQPRKKQQQQISTTTQLKLPPEQPQHPARGSHYSPPRKPLISPQWNLLNTNNPLIHKLKFANLLKEIIGGLIEVLHLGDTNHHPPQFRAVCQQWLQCVQFLLCIQSRPHNHWDLFQARNYKIGIDLKAWTKQAIWISDSN